MPTRLETRRARATSEYITQIPTLNVEGAVALRDAGIKTVRAMPLSLGFLSVYGSTGIELATQAYGLPKPSNIEIARDKIRTVLATRRSTRLQRELMEKEGYSRDDFAGQLGSLFTGGIAVFGDEGLTTFIGAMAFSGGKPMQDEEICARAVYNSGLFSDVLTANGAWVFNK